MYPYPMTLPTDELMTLAKLLRGTGQINAPEDVHACYTVIGYVLGNVLPFAPTMQSKVSEANLSSIDLAARIEQVATMKAGVSLPPIPWNTILSLALQLLQQWLANR